MKKDRRCSTNLSPKDMEKESDDNKLIMWALIDMLVQTKNLVNILNVIEQNYGRHGFHHQMIQHKLDRGGAKRTDKEEFFSNYFTNCSSTCSCTRRFKISWIQNES